MMMMKFLTKSKTHGDLACNACMQLLDSQLNKMSELNPTVLGNEFIAFHTEKMTPMTVYKDNKLGSVWFIAKRAGVAYHVDVASVPRFKLGVYRHYKNKLYHALCVAYDVEAAEWCAVYRALYTCSVFGSYPVWIRPLEMFVEDMVEGDDNPRPQQRFQLVSNPLD